MSNQLPHYTIQPIPSYWLDGEFADWPWNKVEAIPLVRSEDGSEPKQATTLRLGYSEDALYVRFECKDRDVWWTMEQHNDPIYEEEVVEIFIEAGSDLPRAYYEFEVNPGGIAFWARVQNPHLDRSAIQLEMIDVDTCALNWIVDLQEDENRWVATIEIPWEEIAPDGDLPETWRANFYRIDRPSAPKEVTTVPGAELPIPAVTEDEFSAWSPTLVSPADFHQPARFGLLTLG